MFYTIYKVINKLNNKIYIGKHQTKDLNDGYMGSGKLITHAIKKYGLENFEKEILFIFETEIEMNAKEAELVTDQFVLEDTNYNLCPGGRGGFGYLNSEYGLNLDSRKDSIRNWNENARKIHYKKLKTDPEYRKSYSLTMSNASKDAIAQGKREKPSFAGRKHTDETKKKQSIAMKRFTGDKNSQFGTFWITNGIESRKIKEDKIPEGWYKGRKIKKDAVTGGGGCISHRN